MLHECYRIPTLTESFRIRNAKTFSASFICFDRTSREALRCTPARRWRGTRGSLSIAPAEASSSTPRCMLLVIASCIDPEPRPQRAHKGRLREYQRIRCRQQRRFGVEEYQQSSRRSRVDQINKYEAMAFEASRPRSHAFAVLSRLRCSSGGDAAPSRHGLLWRQGSGFPRRQVVRSSAPNCVEFWVDLYSRLRWSQSAPGIRYVAGVWFQTCLR